MLLKSIDYERLMSDGRARFDFLRTVFLYPLYSFIARREAQAHLVQAANAYYRDAFNSTPSGDKAVVMPHCLIGAKCPGKFSKEDGIICVKCALCRCGEIKALCEEQGIQFYITPSIGFTKRLTNRKKLQAALGITCGFEIERGFKSARLTLKGIDLKERRVIPQVVMTSGYDCLKNDTDWDLLRQIILNGA